MNREFDQDLDFDHRVRAAFTNMTYETLYGGVPDGGHHRRRTVFDGMMAYVLIDGDYDAYELRLLESLRETQKSIYNQRRKQNKKMNVIESKIDTSGDEYKANRAHMLELVGELKAELKTAHEDRSDKAKARTAELGKLTIDQRLDRLLDKNTPWLEIAPLAANR